MRMLMLGAGAALLAAVDVATLFLLAVLIGLMPTLGLVFVSTTLGIMASLRWLRRLQRQSEELRKLYGEFLPTDVTLARRGEVILALFTILAFLLPGLLSDLLAFVLTRPAFRQGYSWRLYNFFEMESRRQGKSVEEYLEDGPQV